MAKRQRFQWEEASSPLDYAEKPSRSAKKRAATALQNLAKALFDLDPITLKELDLPQDLLQALNETLTFKSHEAKRRQMQYIGRLMRDLPQKTITAIQIATGQANNLTKSS